jgi:hypothetical protein
MKRQGRLARLEQGSRHDPLPVGTPGIWSRHDPLPALRGLGRSRWSGSGAKEGHQLPRKTS